MAQHSPIAHDATPQPEFAHLICRGACFRRCWCVTLVSSPGYHGVEQTAEATAAHQRLQILSRSQQCCWVVRRWRASPLRMREWTKWFDQQLSASSKTPDQGIYVGLRMDGRVRASGRHSSSTPACACRVCWFRSCTVMLLSSACVFASGCLDTWCLHLTSERMCLKHRVTSQLFVEMAGYQTAASFACRHGCAAMGQIHPAASACGGEDSLPRDLCACLTSPSAAEAWQDSCGRAAYAHAE